MATYRTNNISFDLINSSSATVQFDVEKLDTEWVHIQTATTTIDTSKSAIDIAKDIGNVAKEIATRDALLNVTFLEVIAILTSKEFEV